ncbi:hypothetical protein P175DRAFT_0499966 [Aspergillus ochraceoroseus IBT 24754]|uniref:Uncharacterized protein n=1 Tax=Aspergillus ochraceoroseus IBT 24754 TaxID=1392256 RepID=A0A2T5M4F3_9EURO|nr:uncharacterized protein P175DRAFT_0499966 [Aspergillus ochraceoroseus IBT 24754]PTU23415.1 hypothetical protein P175DRAFT_0499966 [Aspergillus ochraceoroseus IBT 24754]
MRVNRKGQEKKKEKKKTEKRSQSCFVHCSFSLFLFFILLFHLHCSQSIMHDISGYSSIPLDSRFQRN